MNEQDKKLLGEVFELAIIQVSQTFKGEGLRQGMAQIINLEQKLAKELDKKDGKNDK